MQPLVNPVTPMLSRIRRVSPVQAVLVGLAGAALLFAAQKAPPPWEAPARAAARANPFAADSSAAVKGKATYDKLCASCHGKTGHGDGSGSKDLDVKPGDFETKIGAQTDGALFWKISEGRKPMPTFSTKLTDDERWQVVSYVRTLCGGTHASAPK